MQCAKRSDCKTVERCVDRLRPKARWRRWTIALIPGKEPAITMEAKAWLMALRVGKRRSLAIRTNCEQPGLWPAMRAPAKDSVPAAPLGREQNQYAQPTIPVRIRFINHLTSG